METKILVVEDEGVVAEDIRTKLVDLGYEVPDIAFTAEEAISIADREHPDLVLMDISLQGAVDGIAAAKEISRRFSIPVVFLTAFSDQSTIDSAKETEPYGFILKPFTERELQVSVELALHRRSIERGLLRTNRLFENALENVSDAIITTDELGVVNYMNKHAEELTGWARHDAIGEKLTDVFTVREEFDAKIRKSVETALRGQKNGSVNGHAMLLDRDKIEKPVRDNIAPLEDRDGGINGIIVVFRDVDQLPLSLSLAPPPSASGDLDLGLELDSSPDEPAELATPLASDDTADAPESHASALRGFASALARYLNAAMSVIAGKASLADLSSSDREEVRVQLRDIENAADDGRDLAERIIEIVGDPPPEADINEAVDSLPRE